MPDSAPFGLWRIQYYFALDLTPLFSGTFYLQPIPYNPFVCDPICTFSSAYKVESLERNRNLSKDGLSQKLSPKRRMKRAEIHCGGDSGGGCSVGGSGWISIGGVS